MVGKISNENFILFATVPFAQNRLLEVVDQLKSHPNSVIFTVIITKNRYSNINKNLAFCR